MDDQALEATRRSMHGVAESVLAGPQCRTPGTIRLWPLPGGFGSPRITRRLLATFADGRGARARARLEVLTPREREVAVAIAEGLTNAEVARRLHMSESTVKVHVGRIMTKLDATNRTRVAIVTHDAGLA